MDAKSRASAARVGAFTALGGSVCAITGAALGIASGTDIDVSLVSNDMAAYLAEAGANASFLVAGLTVWILMVLLLAVASTAMASISDQRPLTAQIARFCYWAGAPLVIGSYVAWLAVVVQVAPETSPAAIMVAKTVGWFASRADWVGTVLFLSAGPMFISLAGRDQWVPVWLTRWSFVAAFAGLLNVIAMLTGGGGLGTYGFLIIPVGVGWMIAAGIVLLRYRPTDR